MLGDTQASGNHLVLQSLIEVLEDIEFPWAEDGRAQRRGLLASQQIRQVAGLLAQRITGQHLPRFPQQRQQVGEGRGGARQVEREAAVGGAIGRAEPHREGAGPAQVPDQGAQRLERRGGAFPDGAGDHQDGLGRALRQLGELAREADGPVVELAVGNGRVAIPVAQAIGRPMLGIDSSPAMLAIARERAAKAGVELELREQDMRELTLDEPAALIYCPFRAMLHLPTWRDKRLVFEQVAAALEYEQANAKRKGALAALKAQEDK